MVEIMSHLHQYVPTVTYLENFSIQGMGVSVQVPRAILHKILFGGDQLTAARAQGAQRIRMNSTSPQEKLEGLIPCSEDWHTKLNLLGVCENTSSIFLLCLGLQKTSSYLGILSIVWVIYCTSCL